MKIYFHFLKIIFVDFRFFVALGIRLFVVLLTEILNYKYNYEYTDIDYHVFSDGAKHLLKFESPYNRETYRYTPLLAMIVIPNQIINYNFGKVLFSVIDVLVGLSIEIVLNIQQMNKNKKRNENINALSDDNSDLSTSNFNNSFKNVLSYLYSYIDNPFAYTSLLYLYNPLTIIICTRGSADCIITLLVIMTLIFIEIGLFPIAGVVYGFAIHFKIYPMIYAPALYLYLISKDVSINKILNENSDISTKIEHGTVTTYNENYYVQYVNHFVELSKIVFSKFMRKFGQVMKILLKSIFHIKAITFAIVTVGTFCFFLLLFYVLYGNKFFYEYFLYHLVRKDHRHNFSIFHYLIYLTYTSNFSKLLSFLTFAPQVILIILSTIFLFQNINLCLLVLTWIFVTYNKVVTAQYFLWYVCLIPLVAPFNKLFDYTQHGLKVILGIFLLSLWILLELCWNSFSHRLEYKGENLFMEIWIVNTVFFLINNIIVKEIIVSQQINKYLNSG